MTIFLRTAVATFFLLFLSVVLHFPSQAFAQQQDDDSKGDISTENNPNLGQMKEQQILQEQKQDDRNSEKKKDPSTSRDTPTSTGRNDARPERPQRFERPMRPERPHR